MRDIIIILSDFKICFNDQNLEIYEFDKNKSNVSELKKVVIDINKSLNETVYLITNKEDLFEFFNRNIILYNDRLKRNMHGNSI
ncbi:hypothetical protein O8C99_07390 [Aliarcobacter butzleri]|uniref:Uncharacterized protein n=1 Tax=Aliarcobacter butzleri L348 TaxID=1447256 RepID=A0A0G9JZX2_9BACT|nr:hypothetical protein [Aliarcobacter butzleri]KLD99765.1 hypothetical protein AA20_06500 [Aliarcobacter butzleri L348]MDK2081916.1 hypothetical protein [Aliarcobacter butzleri]MDN5060927.1 hypothetical protein [Aliarcobacter butzleri]MDN5103006.1 hypothetical protein [Aliarcobacter butzleri]